ncbi:non-hydrolyzing UDP-N-acetylglucosamine 2-epimerase [Flavobacterium sp.]|uniref:non-hydrolyzing UDP-N-acetylglucosamine 2-epimerase n=1 Tax=Flavobacterium sp. TaxID=239 RepID=UPI0037522320
MNPNFNILICFGTRPEAIKMAPLCLALKQTKIKFKVCVTAQHREMLDQILDFFEIKPDYDLDLMLPQQSLNNLSSRIISAVDAVLEIEKPNLVLVHGDTTTSTMVALAAFHRNIKIGHVEAGLRTFNKNSPFPEEINRQITGRLADIHFAPSLLAKQNLVQEKVAEGNIIITGNTVIDALLWAKQKIATGFKHPLIEVLKSKINFNKKIILVTGHRRENFGDGFQNLCNALLQISKRDDVQIVYPVHLNPNVQKPVYDLLSANENIHLINPVDYPVMIWLMQESYLIITDSGGIQEEAPSLAKFTLITRSTSERQEGIDKGFAKLVGTDYDLICNEANNILDNPYQLDATLNPYGKGDASLKIIEYIENNL